MQGVIVDISNMITNKKFNLYPSKGINKYLGHLLPLLKLGCHPQHNTKRCSCTYDHGTIEK
jgi:hypothetical protein